MPGSYQENTARIREKVRDRVSEVGMSRAAVEVGVAVSTLKRFVEDPEAVFRSSTMRALRRWEGQPTPIYEDIPRVTREPRVAADPGLLELMRDAVKATAAKMGYRQLASAIGVKRSGLARFANVEGSVPYADYWDLIRAWYVDVYIPQRQAEEREAHP
jgi:hypothetical protein